MMQRMVNRLKAKYYLLRKRTRISKENKCNDLQLTPLAKVIFDSQRNTKKRRRWSSEMKSLALQLQSSSNRTYSILMKIFKLPSARTLRHLQNQININEGFHSAILNGLQSISANLGAQQKLCSVVFDEMQLQERLTYNKNKDCIEGLEANGSGQIVDHASVFMLRSMTSKYKQPIGYALSNSTLSPENLKQKIVEAVRSIRKSGFDPRVVIMDLGSNNRSAAHQLGITPQKPYFHVDGQKVYLMYDR